MSSQVFSSNSRYQPAILAIVTVAAAGSIYYLLKSQQHISESVGPPLRRRNALRRRRTTGERAASGDHDNAGSQVPPPPDAAYGDDAVTEQDVLDEDHDQGRQTQRMYQLLYYIQKSRSETLGIVHRGITCDGCNRWPIKGVRYRCCNCPDFDLCEDCEAQDIHLKTHVFYKIRVPAPWCGKEPMPVWYPGKPQLLPADLSEDAKKRLEKEYKCKRDVIHGFYLQFSCIAATKFAMDPCFLGLAIDRAAFDRCFIPQASSSRAIPRHNLVFDRLFQFYDTNHDGLIGFEEFLSGTLLIHNKDLAERKHRVFRGFDLDDDGFVSRADFLRFFRAYYNLNRDLILDNLRMDRDGEDANRVWDRSTPQDLIKSGRSLASYFSEGYAEFRRHSEIGQAKEEDQFGDMIPARNTNHEEGVLSDRSSDHIDPNDIIGGSWTDPYNELEVEICSLMTPETVQESRWGIGKEVMIMNAWGNDRLINEDENLYVKWEPRYRRHLNKAVYIKVSNHAIESALGPDVNWRDWLNDECFYESVQRSTTLECYHYIRQCQDKQKRERVAKRKEHHQFHNIGNQDYSDITLHDLTQEPRYLANGNAKDPTPDKSAALFSPVQYRDRGGALTTYMGSTKAAETIYNITQQALNELLDPLFLPVETKGLQLQRQAVFRERFRDEVQAFKTIYEKLFQPDAVPQFRPISLDEDGEEQDENFPTPEEARARFCKAIAQARTANDGDILFQNEITDEDVKALEDMGFSPKPISEYSVEPSWTEYLAILPDFLHEPASQTAPDSDGVVDPTMPQHRPGDPANLSHTGSDQGIDLWRDPIRIITFLAIQGRQEKKELRKGDYGRLDYQEWKEAMETTSDGKHKLLSWVEGWLGIVQF